MMIAKAIAAAGILAMLAAPAIAGTIDFSTVLTDLAGQPIPTPSNGDAKAPAVPATLAYVADAALLNNYPDEVNSISGEEKVHRFDLAIKVQAGKVDLAAEDVALIKRLVAKSYGPLIVGRAWAILDPQASAGK